MSVSVVCPIIWSLPSLWLPNCCGSLIVVVFTVRQVCACMFFDMQTKLIPRPCCHPVFDHLQYAKMEEKGLRRGEILLCK